MKKVLLYILLALMISDNTSIDQLFKLSFLVEHFQQHKQRDRSLSLMSFLEMHYWGKDLPDHDDEQDNQLPFKKLVVNFHYDFFSPVWHVRLMPPVIHRLPTYELPHSYELPEGYLHTLLKPPRIHPLV